MSVDSEIDSVAQLLAGTTVTEENVVSFAGRGLKLDTEEDAKEVTDSIENCPNMTCLNMEGNTVGINAAKAIAKKLESQPHLRRALWKDMFTGRSKAEIPKALTFLSSGITLSNAHLTELDLSDNAFGPVGVESIVLLLQSQSCYTLEELKLNNNGLGIGGGKILARALQKCHSASTAAGKPLPLKVFICGRNRLENEGAKALATVFKDLGSLQEVAVPQNGIYHEGISAIAEALSQNPDLRVLNLNDNTFTEKGAVAFSKALNSLQKLETINFGDCLLKTGGAIALAEALSSGHKHLKELNIGFNEIGRDGGLAIAKAMSNKKELSRLEMNGNNFGNDGCQQIKNMFESYQKNEQLCSLDDDEGTDADEPEEEEEEEDESVTEVQQESETEIQRKDALQGNGESSESQLKESKLQPATAPLLTGTVVDFFKEPTLSRLQQLGNNRASVILEHLGPSPTYEDYIEAFIKISSTVSDNNEMQLIVLQCIDAVLSRAFNSAENEGAVAILTNALLIHLGLIKCEDKKFAPVKDLKGPLTALQHAINQEYFSHATKDILQFFLSRPNPKLQTYGKLQHALLTTLYQF